MLQRLYVSNYALIEELIIEPSASLTVITGETGAGKSIMLGALALGLGERSDSKGALLDPSRKCIIELTFNVEFLDLIELFEQYDVDYEPESVFRREITSANKSRCFINDTPVSVQTLKKFGERLVDINSQHETQQLGRLDYQLAIVDGYGNTADLKNNYSRLYTQYRKFLQELERLQQQDSEIKQNLDYQTIIFEELDKLDLNDFDEETTLEQEASILGSAELINERTTKVVDELIASDVSALSILQSSLQHLGSLPDADEKEAFEKSLRAVIEEVKEIGKDVQRWGESVSPEPARLEAIQSRLAEIQRLKRKHRLGSLSELIDYRETLRQGLMAAGNLENDIADAQLAVNEAKRAAEMSATELNEARTQVFQPLQEALKVRLAEVGMPNAQVELRNEQTTELQGSGYGFDRINFWFSANRGLPMTELTKSASGGEMSRLLLSIKSIIGETAQLPVLIFDEIDTGVSGDVAQKVAGVMTKLAQKQQVIAITHLPQIASAGHKHYFVYKKESETTTAHVRELTADERIKELATMISGKNPSETALAAARELMMGIPSN
jgi:DNA repair protein RecN (Recombination protein N)